MQTQAQIVNMIGNAITQMARPNSRAVQDEIGLRPLGSGAYSDVYEHPMNRDLVIKIGRQGRDDGWLGYATFCMKNAFTSPYLMQVHDVRLFESKAGHEYYVAVMERLTPYTYHSFVKKYEEMCHWMGYAGPDAPEILQQLTREVGFGNDMHGGNVMWRGAPGGQLVVTDPYSSSNYGYYERYKLANGRIDVTVNVAMYQERLPAQSSMRVAFEDLRKLAGEQGVAGLQPGPVLAEAIRQEHVNAQIAHQKQKLDAALNIQLAALDQRMFQRIQPGQQMRKAMIPPDWFGADFAVVEKRIARHPLDEAIEVVERHIQEAVHVRPTMAHDGSPASIRAEKEDRMLRVRSKHDNLAHRKGLPRTLLQKRGSRWVRTAWNVVTGGLGGKAIGGHSPVVWTSSTSKGLHARSTRTPLRLAA